MSADRRVTLNLTIPDFGAQTLQSHVGGQPERQAPDAEAQERFAAALADRNSQDDREQTPSMPQSMLFSSLQLPSSPRHEPVTPAHQNELASALGSEVSRLMVGDGRSGNRQVRLELKDDVLPGVSVAIQEAEGRLQVDFICRIESSRLKLVRSMPELADTLAQRLRRDVLMRVQADDDEDPCLQEVLATV